MYCEYCCEQPCVCFKRLRLLRNLYYSVVILIECVDYLSLFCVLRVYCIVFWSYSSTVAWYLRRVDCAIYYRSRVCQCGTIV